MHQHRRDARDRQDVDFPSRERIEELQTRGRACGADEVVVDRDCAVLSARKREVDDGGRAIFDHGDDRRIEIDRLDVDRFVRIAREPDLDPVSRIRVLHRQEDERLLDEAVDAHLQIEVLRDDGRADGQSHTNGGIQRELFSVDLGHNPEQEVGTIVERELGSDADLAGAVDEDRQIRGQRCCGQIGTGAVRRGRVHDRAHGNGCPEGDRHERDGLGRHVDRIDVSDHTGRSVVDENHVSDFCPRDVVDRDARVGVAQDRGRERTPPLGGYGDPVTVSSHGAGIELEQVDAYSIRSCHNTRGKTECRRRCLDFEGEQQARGVVGDSHGTAVVRCRGIGQGRFENGDHLSNRHGVDVGDVARSVRGAYRVADLYQGSASGDIDFGPTSSRVGTDVHLATVLDCEASDELSVDLACHSNSGRSGCREGDRLRSAVVDAQEQRVSIQVNNRQTRPCHSGSSGCEDERLGAAAVDLDVDLVSGLEIEGRRVGAVDLGCRGARGQGWGIDCRDGRSRTNDTSDERPAPSVLEELEERILEEAVGEVSPVLALELAEAIHESQFVRGTLEGRAYEPSGGRGNANDGWRKSALLGKDIGV